ncbi:MAG: hypothetical protein ACFCUV_06475 [Rivularia sp. (in: cyanobacteria)]
MLKINFLAVLGIIAIAITTNPVNAQSSRNNNEKGYTLSGDSLTGINQRTANQDFSIFFINQSSRIKPANSNTVPNSGYSRSREQPQIGNTPVLLQPVKQNVNGNDGLQLQFDLTNINQQKDLK